MQGKWTVRIEDDFLRIHVKIIEYENTAVTAKNAC